MANVDIGKLMERMSRPSPNSADVPRIVEFMRRFFGSGVSLPKAGVLPSAQADALRKALAAGRKAGPSAMSGLWARPDAVGDFVQKLPKLLAKRGSLQSMGSGINRILRKLVGAGPSVRGLGPEKAEAVRKALMAGKVPTEKLRGPVSDLFGGLLSGAKGAGQLLRSVSPAQKPLLVNQLTKGVAKSPGRLYDAGFWQRLEDLYKR